MNYSKFPTPINFDYVHKLKFSPSKKELHLKKGKKSISFSFYETGVLRITSNLAKCLDRNFSEAGLSPGNKTEIHFDVQKDKASLQSGDLNLKLDPDDGTFELYSQGKKVIKSAEAPFGKCGTKSILLLDHPKRTVIYGLGEKTGKLDKTGKSYRMWNLDVSADLPHNFMKDDFDPTYVSIPFFISRQGNHFYGVFLNNPFNSFIHADVRTPPKTMIPYGKVRDENEPTIALGTDEGLFDVFLIPGPSLADVVKRYATLTGAAELPPLWALGYQQCRWGYESVKKLAEVSSRLAKEKIPVGAIWMDIDHMEGFRCFTFHKKNFSQKDRDTYFPKIKENGSHLVTIIDPGIKTDPEYPVYKSGKKKDLFCKTPEGKDFRGFVWPGETTFPDFSLPKARKWWAELIKAHLEAGISGIWIDMNDPSCGSITLDDMLFQKGTAPHSAYHNQYGHLMAKATQLGFKKKDPNQRPFILTRSGYSGTQKYSAIWTGDNVSNEDHLAMSIPMSLGLSLSGVSFNGPDVGGFCDHTWEELFVTWNQLGALFPFYRNHSAWNSRDQEPYAFSKKALAIVKNCILTRAKLLPYIYQQFFFHWKDGSAVMRPLSYEFSGEKYEKIDDQYMMGPSLMVAPFTDLKNKTRNVILPPGWWFNMETGKWVAGNKTIRISRTEGIQMFFRDGSIIPCVEGKEFFPQPDMSQISFQVFSKEKTASGYFYEDDFQTRDYQKGKFNLYELKSIKTKNGISLKIEPLEKGMEKEDRIFHYYIYSTGKNKVSWPFREYSVKKNFCEM